MGRIKIIATLLLENVPQLIIQLVYTYRIGDITNSVAMAFLASILSVTATTLNFLIDRDISDNSVVEYYLLIECDDRYADIDRTELMDETKKNEMKQKLIENKGRTAALAERIAEVFEIPPKSIEVGYSQSTSYCGIITHIVHFVDLQRWQHELNNNNVGAMYLVQQWYLAEQQKIHEIFEKFFQFDGSDYFTVKWQEHVTTKRTSQFSSPTNAISGKSNLLKKVATQMNIEMTTLNLLKGVDEDSIDDIMDDNDNIESNMKELFVKLDARDADSQRNILVRYLRKTFDNTKDTNSIDFLQVPTENIEEDNVRENVTDIEKAGEYDTEDSNELLINRIDDVIENVVPIIKEDAGEFIE
eukprot:91896_1